MSDYWKKKIDELEKSTSKSYWEKKEDELKRIQEKQEESKKAIAVESTRGGTGGKIFEDNDIAPVRDDSPWYKRGLFADGYQFGDVTKSILGIEDKKDNNESLIKSYSDPVPLETVATLEAKRDGSKKQSEKNFYNELRNQKYLAQTSKTLSETKMDGTNRSILEEMEIVAGMESGKEKRQRKKAIIEKMEAMGIDSSDYALFVDDTNITAGNLLRWLGNTTEAGLNNFNQSLTNTADRILGVPLQKAGWENNPVSKLNDYYTAMYESSKYDADLFRQKLGGGGGLEFAEQFVEGTTAAVPNAILAIMTAGKSMEGTAAELTRQAAYRGASILEKAGMTAANMIKDSQFWLSFARTYGNSYDKAIEEGADDTTAAFGATISSLLNAGIEIGITGGSGIQGLPQELKKGGMNKILPWVKSSLEEGGEEGLQKFVDEIIGKLLYKSDDEILNPIEYGKEMLMGTLSGAALGGGQVVVQEAQTSISDAVQKRKAEALTENEQKVFDKVVADEIAKAKENGEVSKKDEAKIREDVRTKLERGYLSTDTIEEVLGGDSFKAYRDTVKAEDDLVNQEKTLTEEYNTLNKMVNEKMTGEQQVRRDELRTLLPELRSKIEDQKKNSKRDRLKTKLGEEVKSFVQGSRLAESYNEIGRKREAFQADLSKYDKKQQAHIKEAIESGVLNNSNRTHDLVDLTAKVSSDTGVPIRYSDTQRMKADGLYPKHTVDLKADGTKTEYDLGIQNLDENFKPVVKVGGTEISGYTVDFKNGKITFDSAPAGDVSVTVEGTEIVNAVYTKDGIVLNVKSPKYLETLTGHELYHAIQNSKLDGNLKTALKAYAEARGDYETRLKEKQAKYKGIEGADPEAEVMADLLGEYVFEGRDFIMDLATKNRNVFQKLWDGVKHMAKMATAGSKEARRLVQVEREFEKVYRELSKAQKNTADGGVMHSIGRTKSMSWADQIQGALYNGKNIRRNDTLVVGKPSDTSVANEIDDKPLAIPLSVLTKASSGKDISHSIKKGKLAKLDEGIKNAPITIVNPERNAVVYVTDIKQGGLPVIAAFDMNATFDGDEVHKATSIHLQVDTEAMLKSLPETATVYVRKNELDPVGATNNLRGLAAKIKFIEGTVAQDKQDVKKQFSVSEEVTEEQNERGLEARSEVQYSLSHDTDYMDKAISMNDSAHHVTSDDMLSAKAMRERIAARMTEIKDRGLVGIPEDIEGNTYIANSSYDGTEENTTICPRSLASEAFVDAVSEYLGRPLTVEEQIYISQDLQGRSLTPECTYCYVATDRKAYRAFLGEYINQRDAVIKKVKADPSADVSRNGDLYKEFLSGRKDTKPMYSRFKMWVDAYTNGKPMIEASNLANISKLMGDINSEFGAELKPQIVDAMKYAQSASWAKKRVNYVAYNGHILKWKQDRINKLNSHYGLRMYSFSDFHPAFVLENMQMITDASVRGLKMLGYTKDTDFVEIFAPTGMNINVSTFGFETNGNVYENNIIGAEWEKAKALREQYPNVGITFVATNDTLVNWALDQDWIDVVIPYHLVRTGAEVAKAFGYTNYTSESSDTKDAGWTKGKDKNYIAPTDHNNDKDTYLAALQKNRLKPRFARFLDNPNYMKLVNESRQAASKSKPVQPVFNEDAAMVALAKLEANGYYQPIGGSVERMYEIAAEVAEDMTKQLAPTAQHSLSDANEQMNQSGYRRTLGKDVALEAPAQEDVAPVAETQAEPAVNQTTVEDLFPDDTATVQEEYENLLAERDDIRGAMDIFTAVGDTARADQMKAEYEAVQARIAEIEADEADRLESIREEDAPPEVDNRPEDVADNVPLTKKLVDDLTRSIRAQLGLSTKRSNEVRELIQRYSNEEFPSKAHLYTEIAERFGTYTESSVDEDLKGVKALLRTYGISVDQSIKDEIADYGQLMRRNFGKVRFSNDGLPVDVAYKEFQEALPGYFPEDIYVPTDQLMRIIEVANMDTTMEAEYEIDWQTLEDVTDTIMNGVAEFKQTRKETLANQYGRESFNSLMESADQYAPPVAEDVAPVRQTRPAIESVQADSDDIAPVYDTSSGQQSLMPEQEMDAPISPAVAEVLTEEPETQRKKTSFWSLFQENVLDNGMVFENLSLKKKNRELQAKWNFIRYSQSRAQKLIGEGTTGVRSLDSMRQQVEKPGLTKSFYEYLYHKHNSDRMRLAERYQNTENKAVFGESVTAEMSDAEAERLERMNPSFKRLAQDVYKYNTHLRQMMVDAGIITQEVADLWQEMYPHFVPIRRDLSVELTDTGYVDERKIGVNAPIKRATGGSSNILPLFDTMALTTLQTYKAIAKNNFGVELKNVLGTTVATEQMDLDSAIESVYNIDDLLQAGRNGKNATFTVYENGKKVTFEITDEMYNALKPKSDGMAYTNKLLNTASSLHRGVLTEYNPVFMITNAIKDAQDVLVNSQHPMKTYMRFPAALRELSKNGNWYQEYMENGGGDNTYFDNDTNTFDTEEKGAQKILGIPPLSWISKANNFIEKVPRMAEYIASRESGGSVEVSMLDAARVTTNFAAGGHLTKFLNRNGATFLNASVQGAVQQARNFREAKMNGLKGWAQLASKFAIAGLPALLLNGLMWDDDDEYEELSDYVKQNYYVVAKFDDGKFVRIPKGRAMAVIQNAFEQVSNMATGDDDADLKTFLELVVSNLAPNNPIENNILAPIIQVKNNETWYGEDLVPTRLQDLPAEEQFDESTDAISRWLGEKLKLSPYKINYILDQYTGGVGDTILPMLTPEAESGDDTFFGNMIAPLKSKFTTDSVMNNQNVTDFYDLKDELAINANSRNATDEDVLMYKYINSVSSELGELYGNKREYQNAGDSDSAKYTLVRKTQKEIVEMMEEALNVYSDVQIDGDHAVVGDRHFERNESGQWEKMSDEKVAKYLATSAAGDAPYATDGVNNYRWYQKDGATDGDWRKITDDELKKQNEVTSALGITPEEYWGNKEEYSYAYENPGKYAFAQTVGGYEAYTEYSDALNDIKADKDKFGKSISGTRKTKVAEYISSLDIPMVEKYILFKSEYPSTDDYNYEIIDYVNSRSDMTFEEKIEVLRNLDFDVDAEGNIYW